MARTGDTGHTYNGWYRGPSLDRVAFPLGGLGAGTICVEGTGALSHVSLRHRPDVGNEPLIFSALHLSGIPGGTRVLEGPVPGWKVLHPWGGQTGNGAPGRTFGLPRFAEAALLARFPFATVTVADDGLPVDVEMVAWSPFVPLSADDSSLPVAGIEYRIRNRSDRPLDAVYSFHARNFMAVDPPAGGQVVSLEAPRRVEPLADGFLLWQPPNPGRPHDRGAFCARTPGEETAVNAAWFRGGWFDALSMLWRDIAAGAAPRRGSPPGAPSPGGSLAVSFRLEPGEVREVRLQLSWHAPHSELRVPGEAGAGCASGGCYEPWYTGRFADARAVAATWEREYERLRAASAGFRDAFFACTLPPEVMEAVAANLSILKTPTVLRQADGRLWLFEGCNDREGCCHGSCTHVWNYAQAIPHLFPDLERGLRETEFGEGQDEGGHQSFRVPLPIRPATHEAHAAADGQLGGIIKVFREWRISGDTQWLGRLWPRVRQSLDYCITAWDPRRCGLLEEPHHNTYDVEFWGADGMCTSFYHAALAAHCRMGGALGEDVGAYAELLERGRGALADVLWNGEYIVQKTTWTGLAAGDPLHAPVLAGEAYTSPEAVELLRSEGPKYQYGSGCLSDGVLGFWLAAVSGLDGIAETSKVASHLRSVYLYNFRADLSHHANPQRPAYALGREAGLILCSWPRGGEPSLPFPYAMEVWTGIEYQVASHLMMSGRAEEGLAVVRAARDRYDGTVRDPFDEIECGHWYGRALSSYALLQGLTGIRYDAVDRTLTVSPAIPGDFRSFLCTATGYGHVGVRDGNVYVEAVWGRIVVDRITYTPFGRGER
jgi:uncharacterized protein (DUF608 family)